jgi:hypothetical protein
VGFFLLRYCVSALLLGLVAVAEGGEVLAVELRVNF